MTVQIDPAFQQVPSRARDAFDWDLSHQDGIIYDIFEPVNRALLSRAEEIGSLRRQVLNLELVAIAMLGARYDGFNQLVFPRYEPS